MQRPLLGVLVTLGLAVAGTAAPIAPDDPGLSANLRLWLQADTLGLAPGADVTLWPDSSGNAKDAIARSTGSFVPPTYQVGVAGTLPAVRFSRSAAELMEASNVLGDAAVTDATILAYYRVDSNDERGRPVGFGANTGDGLMPNRHWNLAPDPSLRFDGSNIGSGNFVLSHPANAFLTRTSIKQGQGFTEYFDGSLALPTTTHGPTLNVLDEFFLGDLHGVALPPGVTTADVAEVIVYDRVLSDPERQGVEEYLQQKYSVPRGAYWRFENGSAGAQDPGTPGNILDSSPQANHGTAMNTAGTTKPVYRADVPTASVAGQPNTLSLDFERGDNHYVEVPHDPSLSFGNNAYTLEGYVKLETLGGGTAGSRQYVLVKKEIGKADGFAEYMLLAAAGNLAGGDRRQSLMLELGSGDAGGAHPRIASDLRITDTEWHYISASYDPTAPPERRVRFVLDDQVDYQATTFAPQASPHELVIGGHFNASGNLDVRFDGRLDELRISEGRLPAGALLDPRAAASPAAGYWRFENGSGGQRDSGALGHIVDSSGKENHGTARNSAGSAKPTYRTDVADSILPGGTLNDLSLDFERGENHYVEVPNSPSLDFDPNADTFTVEGWVKLESAGSGPSTTREYIVQKKVIGDGDVRQQYALLANAGDLANRGDSIVPAGLSPTGREAAMAFSTGSQQITALSTMRITDGEWHFLAATFNANNDTIRFVLDDQMEVRTGISMSHFVPTDAPIIIGGHFSNQSVFNLRTDGRLDEVRISSGDPRPHGLVSTAAAQAATRARYRFENGTLGEAPDTPEHIVDYSGFSNHGTPVTRNNSTRPVYSADVFSSSIPLTGEPNAVALDFERGNQNLVTVAHDASISFGDSPFTIEAWVKLESLAQDATGSSTRQYVLQKKRTDGFADAFMDYALLAQRGNLAGGGSPNSLALQLGKGTPGGGFTTIVSDLTITDNDWHYISAAFDPGNDLVRFVLDGAVDPQSTGFVPGESDGPLTLGAHFNAAGNVDAYFDGLIDELRITSGFLPYNELLFIPEPGTLALLGLGLAVLARRRHR